MLDFKDPEQKEEFRRMMDDAIDHWMDKQFAQFGKWTVRGILAAVFAGATWLYFHTGGFKP